MLSKKNQKSARDFSNPCASYKRAAQSAFLYSSAQLNILRMNLSKHIQK